MDGADCGGHAGGWRLNFGMISFPCRRHRIRMMALQRVDYPDKPRMEVASGARQVPGAGDAD